MMHGPNDSALRVSGEFVARDT